METKPYMVTLSRGELTSLYAKAADELGIKLGFNDAVKWADKVFEAYAK